MKSRWSVLEDGYVDESDVQPELGCDECGQEVPDGEGFYEEDDRMCFPCWDSNFGEG